MTRSTAWGGSAAEKYRPVGASPAPVTGFTCPICQSPATWRRYDGGVCPETGYHDAGERVDCPECGAMDAGEVDLAMRWCWRGKA